MLWLLLCAGVAAWAFIAAIVVACFRVVSTRLDELLDEDVEAAIHPLGNVTVLDDYRHRRL